MTITRILEACEPTYFTIQVLLKNELSNTYFWANHDYSLLPIAKAQKIRRKYPGVRITNSLNRVLWESPKGISQQTA